jgi:non-reducing end alpha-L-arabinofuranosidase
MRYSGVFNRFNALLVLLLLAVAQPSIAATTFPCDIYASAGTPCVAAYSTVRLLSSTYTGPLYQVRRTSDSTTKDIPLIAGGTVADAAVQDSFLGTGAGTISKIYDQSGKGNNLTVAKKGSYTGTAAQNDKEANAKGKSFMINGHKAYALFTIAAQGYRTNQEGYTGYPAVTTAANGVPTGTAPLGIYALEDGSRANVGCCCCFDFGVGSLNNAAGGTGEMCSVFFGTGYWGKGTGTGPWFLNDMENGVWAGGSGASGTSNSNLPSSKFDFAFGLTKSSTTTTPQYAIRVANGTVGNGASPKLITAYDGQAPATWKTHGSIVLGIGGDNSNSSSGTFYEGCITAGRPSDKTDTLILLNIQAAAYGTSVTTVHYSTNNKVPTSRYNVSYTTSNASTVISYTLQDARRVNMNIYDLKGRQIASIVNETVPAGRHEAVWNTNRNSAGAYICKADIDGIEGWSEKFVVGK